jgi:hypothetical protein
VKVIVARPVVLHDPGTLGTMRGRAESAAIAAEKVTDIGEVPPTPPAPFDGVVERTRNAAVAAARCDGWWLLVTRRRSDGRTAGACVAEAPPELVW